LGLWHARYEELRELADYWREQYDWRKHEAAINSFANYKSEIDVFRSISSTNAAKDRSQFL
jgi:Epoxide hydrolase N terminus